MHHKKKIRMRRRALDLAQREYTPLSVRADVQTPPDGQDRQDKAGQLAGEWDCTSR